MSSALKWVSTLLLALVAIPIATIYRQNVEEVSSEVGLSRMLVKVYDGMGGDMTFGVLIFVFVFLLGSTAALWLYVLFRRWFEQPSATLASFEFSPGRRQMFTQPNDTNKLMLLAGGEGDEFHIYIRLNTPIETPHIVVQSSSASIEWLERDCSDRSILLSFRGMHFLDRIFVVLASEERMLEGKSPNYRRQPNGLWMPTWLKLKKLKPEEANSPQIKRINTAT